MSSPPHLKRIYHKMAILVLSRQVVFSFLAQLVDCTCLCAPCVFVFAKYDLVAWREPGPEPAKWSEGNVQHAPVPAEWEWPHRTKFLLDYRLKCGVFAIEMIQKKLNWYAESFKNARGIFSLPIILAIDLLKKIRANYF